MHMNSRSLRSSRGSPRNAASIWRDLAREAARYVLTGLLGATAVVIYTGYRRLPSHALTISPGGVTVVVGSVVSCADRQYIAEILNAYLTDEIVVPTCTAVL